MPKTDVDLAVLPMQGIEVPGFHRLLADLRAEGPVAEVNFRGFAAWAVLGHAEVQEAFRDEVVFSPRITQEVNTFPVMGRNLMGMEGAEHRAHRALVSPAFRRVPVARSVERILRPLCHELVDDIAADGAADLVASFSSRLPFAVIARLLGIPTEDEPTLKRWALALISYGWDEEGARAASAEFVEYLRPVLAARRRNPSDDLVSTLVNATFDGRRLEEEELFSFLRLLFPAGADTTYLALGSMLTGLLTHPDELAELRADPHRSGGAVEETLRWEGPTALLPRITAVDAVFGGVEIPAGSVVLLGITAANRDPAVFPDPDRFDLDRDNQHHVAFGFGNHFCLGAHLARAEMRVGLEVLLERLDDLRLEREPRMLGAVLRGPDAVEVRFRPAATR